MLLCPVALGIELFVLRPALVTRYLLRLKEKKDCGEAIGRLKSELQAAKKQVSFQRV